MRSNDGRVSNRELAKRDSVELASRKPRGSGLTMTLLAAVGLGACGFGTTLEEIGSPSTQFLSTFDTPCLGLNLTVAGSMAGKVVSLAGAPLAASTWFGSTSTADYATSACVGSYVVELSGIDNLPRAGETMRFASSVNAKLLPTLNQSRCATLKFLARALVHTTANGGSWASYGHEHALVGSWNGLSCALVATSENGEIPPFPFTAGRDKIRIVGGATVANSAGATVTASVALGVTLGTAAPTQRGTGAVCDADDECRSNYCAAGNCCGTTAAERRACDWRETLATVP